MAGIKSSYLEMPVILYLVGLNQALRVLICSPTLQAHLGLAPRLQWKMVGS